jgi:hypothetical protein
MDTQTLLNIGISVAIGVIGWFARQLREARNEKGEKLTISLVELQFKW